MNSTRQDFITARISNAFIFCSGDFNGKMNLSCDVPMSHWPAHKKWPNFRSSWSAFTDGECIETWKGTPFEWFYEPDEITSMPAGNERWKRYSRYVEALKREIQTYIPFQIDGTGNLKFEGWILLPSREQMLKTLGFDN